MEPRDQCASSLSKEMFGTVAIFTDDRYPADAEAVTDARVASWSEADLQSLIGRYPGIALAFIQISESG